MLAWSKQRLTNGSFDKSKFKNPSRVTSKLKKRLTELLKSLGFLLSASPLLHRLRVYRFNNDGNPRIRVKSFGDSVLVEKAAFVNICESAIFLFQVTNLSIFSCVSKKNRNPGNVSLIFDRFQSRIWSLLTKVPRSAINIIPRIARARSLTLILRLDRS